jgi:hypothetical protein
VKSPGEKKEEDSSIEGSRNEKSDFAESLFSWLRSLDRPWVERPVD